MWENVLPQRSKGRDPGGKITLFDYIYKKGHSLVNWYFQPLLILFPASIEIKWNIFARNTPLLTILAGIYEMNALK